MSADHFDTKELCPHCIAIRGGARRLRKEIAARQRAYARLQSTHEKLKAELEALKKAASKELIRYNVGPNVKRERVELAMRLRVRYSAAEIGVLMGYSRQRIHQMLKENNYPTTKHRPLSENLTLRASRNFKSLNPQDGTDDALPSPAGDFPVTT